MRNYMQKSIINFAVTMEEENELKLLIRTRLDYESEFMSGRKRRSVLWCKVLEDMKKVNPNIKMTKEQITRKFLNLVTTYKRIKNRNMTTGKDVTSWEFFDDFEEVYGDRHAINPLTENLQSSLDLTRNTEWCEINSFESTRRNKRQKVANDGVLEFLRDEATKEQQRHEEVIALEREKLAVEKERIGIMIQLKNLLGQALRE